MGLFKRMRERFWGEENIRSKNDSLDNGGFTSWFKPYDIFADKSEHALANNEVVFAAITKLSNTMASLPLKLYKEFEPQFGHDLNYIMSSSPNSNMTSLEFMQTMEVLRNVYGNAYAVKHYDKSMCVDGLHILDPTKVEPVLEEKENELYYRITLPDRTYYLHNHEVIHVKQISTGYKGISPIDVLRNTINYDNKIKKFSTEQMDTSIKASFILRIPANLDIKKKLALKHQFEEFYSKNGGVIMLDAGQMLDRIKGEFIDPKMFEVEKITRARVALVFNIPLYKFGGDSDRGNEQQALGFLQDTVLPIVRQYEQEFDRKLLTIKDKMSGYAFKFNINGLLRADTNTRGDFYFKGIRTGFLTLNEVRAWEELPPKEGGDKLYMSKDLRAVGDNEGGDGNDSDGNSILL